MRLFESVMQGSVEEMVQPIVRMIELEHGKVAKQISSLNDFVQRLQGELDIVKAAVSNFDSLCGQAIEFEIRLAGLQLDSGEANKIGSKLHQTLVRAKVGMSTVWCREQNCDSKSRGSRYVV